jgi:hypothetical protein
MVQYVEVFNQKSMKNRYLVFSMVKYVSIYLITTNLGVGGSNPLQRANKINDLIFFNFCVLPAWSHCGHNQSGFLLLFAAIRNTQSEIDVAAKKGLQAIILKIDRL